LAGRLLRDAIKLLKGVERRAGVDPPEVAKTVEFEGPAEASVEEEEVARTTRETASIEEETRILSRRQAVKDDDRSKETPEDSQTGCFKACLR